MRVNVYAEEMTDRVEAADEAQERHTLMARHTRWFESRRIAFIAEMLHIYGFINREHLMRKFDISRPQASKDLKSFRLNSAGAVSYNPTTKRYEARGTR